MALEPITRQEQIIAGKDLEPITRMEKFLKKYGGSGGSGGGVSPEEVTTIVKEQFPGGVGYEEVTDIVPNTVLTFSSMYGMKLVEMVETYPFVAGETYEIVWNGVSYKCVAIETPNYQGHIDICVGDLRATGEEIGNGEPFGIVTGETGTMVLANDGSDSATVIIRGFVTKKLDKKYLPDGVGGVKYVTIGENDYGVLNADASYDEIATWIRSGVEVKAVYGKCVATLQESSAISDIATFDAVMLDRHSFCCVQRMANTHCNLITIDIESDGSVYANSDTISFAV